MKRHTVAYQQRAGLIGALQSCICTWPLDVEPTTTGHNEACPAHMTLVHYAGVAPELSALYSFGRAAELATSREARARKASPPSLETARAPALPAPAVKP